MAGLFRRLGAGPRAKSAATDPPSDTSAPSACSSAEPRSPRPTARFSRISLLAVIGILVCGNLLGHVLGPAAHVPLGIALVAALLTAAQASGLTREDLGLASSTLRSGLRWGGLTAFLVAVVYAVALAVPPVRSAIADSTPRTWGHDLTKALLTIPLGTVVPEELAFRGVLLCLLSDRYGLGRGSKLSSMFFALWHVLPALGGGAANEALDRSVGAGSAVVRLAATMAVTFLAGMLLCALRRRSGSLLAPALTHWAVNGFGVFLVRFA